MKSNIEFNATFSNYNVLITEESQKSFLQNKGSFGEFHEGILHLSYEEALYLIEYKNLKIFNLRKKEIKKSDFIKKILKKQKRFLIKYHTYKFLKNKGHVVKAGLKFGCDFRVYEKGDKVSKDHAKYLCKCFSEEENINMKDFASLIRIANSVKKILILSVVDFEGGVTIYKCSWKR